jgi:hypothetical protein
MRTAVIAAVLLALACPAAYGEERGTQVYGPRQIVTIEIMGVADEIQRDEITRRIPELMDPGEYVTRFYTDPGLLTARVAPISDVNAFASRIDFGKVTRINGRTIIVKATPVPGAGSAAASPLNRALAGLKSSDADVLESALEQLAEIKPIRARRTEVLQALLRPLGGTDVRAKTLAIEALGVWGTRGHVPALVELLDNRDARLRCAAIRALGQLKDPAAIAPIARRLDDHFDRHDAVKALVALGPAAEEAVLPALANQESDVRRAACEILEEIGSADSVAALKAAQADSNTWVRSAAADALKAVYRRGGGQRPSGTRSRSAVKSPR